MTDDNYQYSAEELFRRATQAQGLNGHGEVSEVGDLFEAPPGGASPTGRHLKVTRASSIGIKPVHWLWADPVGKVPLGSLTLLAGREGIGKSTIAYQFAADLTTGRLPGCYEGQAKAVVIVATEDSWESTIVPRLMAADADLDRVLRVDAVEAVSGTQVGLSLPRDLADLEEVLLAHDVALVLLDPLMSRLSAALDTYKDAEVRHALEPLTAVCDRTRSAMLGLIHLNKGRGVDPLTMIMGSRAFSAVARAVLFAARDDDDETGSTCVLGNPKNNLGRSYLPELAYRITEVHVADTSEGPVYTGKVRWLGTGRSIRDILEDAEGGGEVRGAAHDAGEWLTDYLEGRGGSAARAEIVKAARAEGHALSAVNRAKKKLGIGHEMSGFPKTTVWFLPGATNVED